MTNFNLEYSGVDGDSLVTYAGELGSYREHLERVVSEGDLVAKEASLCLPTDTVIQTLVNDLVSRYKTEQLRHIIVIGIGGSNLGTQAIYNALGGDDQYPIDGQGAVIHFLDTFDQKALDRLLRHIDDEVHEANEFVVNIISKSGSTTETIANFELLYKELSQIFGDIRKRIVVTTDKGSVLWKRAEDAGFVKLPIPKRVGGRYSVFSAVGIFPLSLAGVPVNELLEGARSMRDTCVSDVQDNPAIGTAAALHFAYTNGYSAHNNFFFEPRLETVGKWYRQLMGESLGKEYDVENNEVHAGMIPLVSIGSTDLHSVGQLYFSGPRTIFTTLVSNKEHKSGPSVEAPEAQMFGGIVEDLSGRTLSELQHAVTEGVKRTYIQKDLPHIAVEFDTVDAFALGEFLQYQMITIMYLAELMRVNAFDQPGVDTYKEETRKILKNMRD